MGGVTFSQLPPSLQFQSAVFGPFLFGLVGGFLLGESEAGYWIVQAVGAALAVTGGMEHTGAAAGARRGAVTALMFALGIVAADAISGDPALAEVPEPLILVLIPIAVVGTAMGTLGGWLRGRRG